MRHMKKFMALFAALALVLAMAVPAFAATTSPVKSEDQGSGTITITNAHNGETYKIYRMFDLVSYVPATNGTPAKASYAVTSAWKSFIQSNSTYITLDANDHPTWVNGASEDDFAKLAKAAAANMDAQAEVTAADGEAKFTNLKDGYYLINTTTGTLCSLNTATGSNVNVADKNDVPSVDKKVDKSNGANDWGTENTAKIGDTVSYQTTIHVKNGAEGYVLHDKMEAGLTLNANSFTVKVDNVEVSESAATYTIKKNNFNDNCTFEIEFADSYVAGLANKDIVVTYTATLNGDAEIVTGTNDNETWLKYGNSSNTAHQTTQTKVYSFDLVKTDELNNLLAGAKFELYADTAHANKISLVKEDTNTYRVATAEEAGAEDFVSAVIESNATSKITVKGLKGETSYYLVETEAPAGYNKLTSDVVVTINSDNLSANLTGTQYAEGNGGVHVENKAGTTLPSTGGIGTTIFYVVGGGLMVAAAVLLVAKKRMENK